MNAGSVRYWLLLLRKPGQCMVFDAREYGITVKTLVAYIEACSGRRGGVFKTCRIGNWLVGVRRVRTSGGEHAK